MNDFFAFIKALIEKVNLIVLLLSVAVGILVYKIWIPDSLWAICVFCVAYPCLWGIYNFIVYQYHEHCARVEAKEREARKAKEEQEKYEERKAYYSTIYESLSDGAKRGLILLYRLPVPKDGLITTRIVDMNNEEHKLIWHFVCTAYSVINNRHTLLSRDSTLNSIVHIDPIFYNVLEEKSKTFSIG